MFRSKSTDRFALGLLALGCSLLSYSQQSADENPHSPNHGRLPDGRAFRIDQASGLRLSDYIAELEVSADDLRRQVVALEDELNERRQTIEQYERQTGVKVSTKIKTPTCCEHHCSIRPFLKDM